MDRNEWERYSYVLLEVKVQNYSENLLLVIRSSHRLITAYINVVGKKKRKVLPHILSAHLIFFFVKYLIIVTMWGTNNHFISVEMSQRFRLKPILFF